MKAVIGALPTDDEGWGYEIKWDGVRVLAFVTEDGVSLRSSNGNDITASYPELGGLSAALGGKRALLDGEVVALDERGQPSFGLLQQRMHVQDRNEAARRSHDVPIVYEIFDLLWLDGADATGLPFCDRRRLLDELIEPNAQWPLSKVFSDGQSLFAAAEELGMEGIVAKRLDSRYVPGTRAAEWRKIKVRLEQEFVVGGWHPGSGRRDGLLGALLLGYHEGDALRYAGKVGTGFTERELERLQGLLGDLALAPEDPNPFEPPPPRADARLAHWVRPELVVQVAFGEWTSDGRLRHPAYLGQRTDKDPSDVVRE